MTESIRRIIFRAASAASIALIAGAAFYVVAPARAEIELNLYNRIPLIDAAGRAGLWKLVSRVFVDNTVSRRLMASMGFREVGIYEKHGKLDGVWRDAVIVERLIPDNIR